MKRSRQPHRRLTSTFGGTESWNQNRFLILPFTFIRFRRAGGADFAGSTASLFFESAEREGGGILTIDEIIPNPLLESAASFALRDMHEIMQEQFAVAPGFGANHDAVAEADATCVRADDMPAPGGLRQWAGLRQRNPIDKENANTLAVPHPGPARISELLRT